jgi:lysophospholipase L1-like esterase
MPRSTLGRVAALLIGLALAVVVLEGALRLYADRRAVGFEGQPTLTADKVADPILVMWFKPNYESPDAAYDTQGFRLNGRPRSGSGERRVALLGGSTAYGWGTADDETISAVLERNLHEHATHESAVINAGFPGLTTFETLLVYHARVAALRPSTVIVLAGLNDLFYAADWGPKYRLYWLNNVFETSLRARHDAALQPVVQAVNSIALRQCFTCYYLSSGLSRLFDRTGATPLLTASQSLGQQPMAAPNERAMQLTAWSLGELARRVKADGGCLIVAWQPVAALQNGHANAGKQAMADGLALKVPAWSSVAPAEFAQLRTDTRELFASGAAREVDLSDLFDGSDHPVFVDDGVHYTPVGNRLIAEALEPAVAECDGPR